VLFFFYKVQDLRFDLNRAQWADQAGFMEYSIQWGRALLQKRHKPANLATQKWRLILPPCFKFD
jgi:hypothetical protein